MRILHGCPHGWHHAKVPYVLQRTSPDGCRRDRRCVVVSALPNRPLLSKKSIKNGPSLLLPFKTTTPAPPDATAHSGGVGAWNRFGGDEGSRAGADFTG